MAFILAEAPRTETVCAHIIIDGNYSISKQEIVLMYIQWKPPICGSVFMDSPFNCFLFCFFFTTLPLLGPKK